MKEERNPATETTATAIDTEEDANEGNGSDFAFSTTATTLSVSIKSPLNCPTAMNEVRKLSSMASSLTASLWFSISSFVLVPVIQSCPARRSLPPDVTVRLMRWKSDCSPKTSISKENS